MQKHLTSLEGENICVRGWKVSGIHDAVNMTSVNLPNFDPFVNIVPLFSEKDESETLMLLA